MLSDAGAECLQCPTIEVGPPKTWQPLDDAVGRIADYNWLVFTSVNGVAFFFERLFAAGKDTRALRDTHVAAIGPATSERLLDFGVRCDVIPKTYRAESVVDAFAGVSVSGKNILLPRAKEARSVLPTELTRMGARVDEICAYETRTSDRNVDSLIERLENKTIDCLTFTSSSTVKNLKKLLPPDRFKDLIRDVTVACIGPITAGTAESLGFNVHIVAEEYTIPGLYKALIDFYK